MFIPIHDEDPRLHTPVGTIAIVGAIVLAWFGAQGAGSGYGFARSLCELGLIPGECERGNSNPAETITNDQESRGCSVVAVS